MTDLSILYAGLELKNPVIAGSSPITGSLDGIRELEKNGAAAVVLKSLFEEEILMEADSMSDSGAGVSYQGEAEDYLNYYVRQNSVDAYLKLIGDSKKNVSIPVIASINCVSDREWTSFASRVQDAGADALELNMFILPSDPNQKGEDLEKLYFAIVKKVLEQVSIPVALKIHSYFSGMANMAASLSSTGIKGLVLFNRFYSPDMDLNSMEITSSGVYSTPAELAMPLRWTGILYDRVNCDLAVSTGVHDSSGVIKSVLAGAAAAYVVTALYKMGTAHIGTMLGGIEKWMKGKGYKSCADFRGLLSQRQIRDPQLYERAQFMKHFSSQKW